MSAPALVAHTALELSDLIHRREVSCVEVMTAHLEQIDRLNPTLNAVVGMRQPDELLAEARARDAELAPTAAAAGCTACPTR